MAGSELVDDELWELVKPLLPDRLPQRTGRPHVSDRAACTAIVFVLRTPAPSTTCWWTRRGCRWRSR